MSDLLKINVSEHCEKKNGLTYLSWAWAWAEVLKIDPKAVWEVLCPPAGGIATFLPDGSALVCVQVEIKGDKKSSWLPVMDHRNKAIKNPDAFAINTAIMRCLAKAIAMHGLGLYIYAGEDLPESDGPEPSPPPPPHLPPNHVPPLMPAAVIADWIASFESCATVEELADQRTAALASAKKAQDHVAYAALDTASRKRKAELS